MSQDNEPSTNEKLPVITDPSIIAAEIEVVKDLESRTKKLLKDPNLLDVICSVTSSGGSLTTLCELWRVRYGDVCNWIHMDDERERRYKAALADRLSWAEEKVLSDLRVISALDPRQLFKDDGQLKPINEWPLNAAKAVSSVEVNELFEGTGRDRAQVGWTKKIRFFDKMKALELLGKNLGLFIDRTEHIGKLTLEDIINNSHAPRPEDKKLPG